MYYLKSLVIATNSYYSYYRHSSGLRRTFADGMAWSRLAVRGGAVLEVI